mmetsp:Transcript_15958/g.17717  ORF Transcript_15958/g.17717 Transcript_15958/m.17717 type:complete len:278 (+) Transcript_15958:249-1082(+)
MAIGGKVIGDCLECPFHGWRFDGSGQCIDIPYTSGNIPEAAKVRSYPVLERHGLLFFFYHEDSKVSPCWEPPVLDDIDVTKNVYFHGKSEHHVYAHIQDIPENGADIHHLSFVHRSFAFVWLQWILEHRWDAAWDTGGPGREFMSDMYISQAFRIFGYDLDMWIRTNINQVGPGIVTFVVHIPLLGRLVSVETVTPLGKYHQCVKHYMYGTRWVPIWIGKLFLQFMLRQFERDIPIWNNKIHRRKPVLVKEEGVIMRYRRWYAQFYSTEKKSKRTED